MDKFYTNNYLCLDIETTGLEPVDGAEITEIAIAKIVDGNIIKTFSSLCAVETFIPENITELTGINNIMTQYAPKVFEVLEEIIKIFKINNTNNNILIHNVNFDKNFIGFYIKKYLKHYNDIWNLNNFICSLEFSKKVLPNNRHRLCDLKDYFGIKSKGHRALNDVLCTIKVYEELKKIKI